MPTTKARHAPTAPDAPGSGKAKPREAGGHWVTIKHVDGSWRHLFLRGRAGRESRADRAANDATIHGGAGGGVHGAAQVAAHRAGQSTGPRQSPQQRDHASKLDFLSGGQVTGQHKAAKAPKAKAPAVPAQKHGSVATPKPAPAFTLTPQSAHGRKATTFESKPGTTRRMFDMKAGDLPGQTSMFDRAAAKTKPPTPTLREQVAAPTATRPLPPTRRPSTVSARVANIAPDVVAYNRLAKRLETGRYERKPAVPIGQRPARAERETALKRRLDERVKAAETLVSGQKSSTFFKDSALGKVHPDRLAAERTKAIADRQRAGKVLSPKVSILRETVKAHTEARAAVALKDRTRQRLESAKATKSMPAKTRKTIAENYRSLRGGKPSPGTPPPELPPPAAHMGHGPGSFDRAIKLAAAHGIKVQHGELGGLAAQYFDRSHAIILDRKHFEAMDRLERAKQSADAGFFSSAHPDHTIHHEIGHALHAKAIGAQGMYQRNTQYFDPQTKATVAKHVSEYGASNKGEFVAEVYAGMAAGKRYPPEIMGMYKELGGPATAAGGGARASDATRLARIAAKTQSRIDLHRPAGRPATPAERKADNLHVDALDLSERIRRPGMGAVPDRADAGRLRMLANKARAARKPTPPAKSLRETVAEHKRNRR